MDDGSSWQKRSYKEKFSEGAKQHREETYQAYIDALEDLFEESDDVSAKDLAEALGKSKDTIRKDFCGDKKNGKYRERLKNKFKEAGYFYGKGGVITKTDTVADTMDTKVSEKD